MVCSLDVWSVNTEADYLEEGELVEALLEFSAAECRPCRARRLRTRAPSGRARPLVSVVVPTRDRPRALAGASGPLGADHERTA